jgi:hypothetical protein
LFSATVLLNYSCGCVLAAAIAQHRGGEQDCGVALYAESFVGAATAAIDYTGGDLDDAVDNGDGEDGNDVGDR